MMKDQYANYVVQKILDTCDDQQREVLIGRIRASLPSLRKFTYGKHIVARVEQLLSEGLLLFHFSLPFVCYLCADLFLIVLLFLLQEIMQHTVARDQ